MKRTVQMAKRGIPEHRKERDQSPYPWHNTSPTLGAVPMAIRSLVAIGGARDGCKFTKRRKRMAKGWR